MSQPVHTLHFTLGPVQEFVSQARRTRDLWAGSYLLSYLSGHAMHAVAVNGGRVVFPCIKDDPLMLAISDVGTARGKGAVSPIGSLPNRFKAHVPRDMDGTLCTVAINRAWSAISDSVRRVLTDGQVRINDDIWDRQIGSTWVCSWAIGEDDSLVDARKNLRVQQGFGESGEKCTVCGERQELSGFGMGSPGTRRTMYDWWDECRDRLRGSLSLPPWDLRPNERLCAVCLTKRLFPHVFPHADQDGKTIGWEVPVTYPSTDYMAAVDWIVYVLKECEAAPDLRSAVHDLVTAARKADVPYAEAATHIRGISEALKSSGLRDEDQRFVDLDGGVFFESTIRNVHEFPIGAGAAVHDISEPENEKELRHNLLTSLRHLQDRLPERPDVQRQASPFFALLLMDGDHLGKNLTAYRESQDDISRALSVFNRRVVDTVARSNGRLVYAGGDDVLALLPVATAIECARACRDVYNESFEKCAGFIPVAHRTISAAVVYAHMQTPLGVVVRDAHRLLTTVAKARTGRDALACRVWKRGGPILTWSLPWETLRSSGGDPARTLIDDVREHIFGTAQEGRFSSRFLHAIGGLFELLEPPDQPPQRHDVAVALLTAEYLTNRELDWGTLTPEQIRQHAEEHVTDILALCREQARVIRDQNVEYDSGRIRGDGALLARFLVQKEV